MTSIERVDPPLAADEAATLRGFLDYHRATLLRKTDGLTQEQLNQPLAPSDMTLGGMVKHVAFNEHWWFSCVLHGAEYAEPWASVDWDADSDWEWHTARDDTPEQLRALLDGHIAESDELIDRALADGGLDTLSARASSRRGVQFSLRWIITHMIEEYARHNGHADLIRQSIDGATGE
ncbi:DinB family protein [Nocardioides jensenii]|uniref:DinB family protein n=1 Tax=Nocardioides jensenii TaxID=1843 RepID=UPI000830E3E2|nr:DinB family protein [Nocardioides jensenii]